MALTGLSLAPDPTISTVPIAMIPVATMLTTVPAAHLMSRWGRRSGFLLGACIGAAGAAICAAAVLERAFYLLCVGALGLGAANGFATYYRFAAAEVVKPQQKSRAISYVMVGGIAAAIAGSHLAPRVKSLLPEHPYAGIFLCILGLQTVLIAALLLSSLPGAPPAENGVGEKRSLAELARHPHLAMAVLGAAASWGIMSLLMHATPLAMERHGHTFEDTTQVVMWHALGMYGPAFFTGHLVARFGEAKMMFAGAALIAVSALVNAGGTELRYFYVGLSLLGLGWNFLFVGSTSLLTGTYSAEEKARVQSANDFLIFAAMVLSALAAGSLEHLAGWEAVNEMALVTMVAVTACMVWLHRQGGRS